MEKNESVKKGDFLTCISDPSKVVIFGGEAGFFGGCSTFTILYDLPMRINGEMAYTGLGVKFPFNNFRHSTEEEKALMIEEMEKLGKRYNPETFKIEDITKNESVKNMKTDMTEADKLVMVTMQLMLIENGFEGIGSVYTKDDCKIEFSQKYWRCSYRIADSGKGSVSYYFGHGYDSVFEMIGFLVYAGYINTLKKW